MSRSERIVFIMLMVSAIAVGTLVSECKADDHRVYLGTHWTHLSNIDAGPGYNDEHEDRVEHIGINVEYQYHVQRSYLFASFGVGYSYASTSTGHGWSCGGCSLPSSIQVGYKFRIR